MFDFEVQKLGMLAKSLEFPYLAKPAQGANKPVALRFVRNWPAEPVLRRIMDFGGLVGMDLQITLSPYSDSLLVEENVTEPYDICVIWLDEERLSQPAIKSLTVSAEKIALSRPQSAFYMVCSDGMRFETSLPNLRIFPYTKLAGSDLSDMKYGHHFASPGYLPVLRQLVIEKIATASLGAYRLIAVDFDHTLYDGVLGEDSAFGLSFTNGRVALIRKLSELATRGCLLFGLTKNDSRDINELFAQSEKFGLTREMFWRISADWSEKPNRLVRAVEEANLHLSMTLFIDDNIAELERMAGSCSQVDLLGSWDPEDTLLALNSGHRIPTSKDQNWRNRISDLASRDRRLLDKELSAMELHSKLESKVQSALVQSDELERVQELLLKTNQFNLSLGRIAIRQVADQQGFIITRAKVSDKFGDSGLVAVLVSKIDNNALQIVEFCISCRVLGRGLEEIIFASLVSATGQECKDISMTWRDGPRNKPALDWLRAISGTIVGNGGCVPISTKTLNQIRQSEAYEIVAES